MHQYPSKKQIISQNEFICPKQTIFALPEVRSYSIVTIQQNSNSKIKIPRLNNSQAKAIFHDLNYKESIKQVITKKNWKFEEVSLLVFLVEKLCCLYKISNLNDIDDIVWEQAAEFLPCRNHKDCKYKILSLTATTITDIPWSLNERNILTDIIEEYGMNWNLVSQKLYEKSQSKIFRTSKQCRQHYMCFLKPNLKKGAWTDEQDYKLAILFLEFGRKWSKIMKYIEGRNQNSIKNRFFLLFENRGKTSNNAELVRKVNRKKEKMQKYFEQKNQTLPTFSLINSKTESKRIHKLPKSQVIQDAKIQNQPQTKKGQDQQFSTFLMQDTEEVKKENQNEERLVSQQKISLINLNSLQHLQAHQAEFHNQRNNEALNMFDDFEQYICF